MNGINKIISLLLGLVVVMILFAIITGKFNPFKPKTMTNNGSTTVIATVTATPTPSQKKFLGIFPIGKSKPTVTPTPTITSTPGQKKFLGIFPIGKSKPTVTPTPTPEKVVVNNTQETTTQNHNYANPISISPTMPTRLTPAPRIKDSVGSVSTIPSTGSPTELLPLMSSALLAGVYLRRKK